MHNKLQSVPVQNKIKTQVTLIMLRIELIVPEISIKTQMSVRSLSRLHSLN